MPFNAHCPGCGSLDPCNCGNKPQSSEIKYVGPNLSCTGIQTCDDLSTALQKIDHAICVIQQAIAPSTSTTSTTTIAPTTSTTTTACINFNYRVVLTAEDLLDSTGNTGVEALGPNGQEYTALDGRGFLEGNQCNGSSFGGSGFSGFDDIVCASQPPYIWYYKNDQYVLVDGVTNLETLC